MKKPIFGLWMIERFLRSSFIKCNMIKRPMIRHKVHNNNVSHRKNLAQARCIAKSMAIFKFNFVYESSVSLDVTTTKTWFSCGCLCRYRDKITLDLQTTVFLITRKSSLNSRCQFSIAVCKELKFQRDMFSWAVSGVLLSGYCVISWPQVNQFEYTGL